MVEDAYEVDEVELEVLEIELIERYDEHAVADVVYLEIDDLVFVDIEADDELEQEIRIYDVE